MAQQMPLPLFASVKSRLVLPIWYRLTQVVPNKGPVNVHVCVCSNGNSPARVSDLVADFEVKEGEQKSCVKTGNR